VTVESARLIVVLDVYCGADKPPAVASSAGAYLWEDRDLVELAEEILGTLSGRWRDVVPLGDDFRQTLRGTGFLSRAIGLIRGRPRHPAVLLISDPRMVNLLDFWREAFRQCELDVRYVLMLRDPRATDDKALLSWMTDLLSALSGTAHEHRRVLVDWRRLLLDCELELRRIAARVDLEYDPSQLLRRVWDLPGPEPAQPGAADRDARKPTTLSNRVEDVLTFLRRIACDEVDINAPEATLTVKQFGADLDLLQSRFELEDARRQIAKLQAQLDRAERYQETLNDSIADRRSTIKALVDAAATISGPDSVPTLQAILAKDDAAFVRTAYLILLQREPDPGGRSYYLGQLRAGKPKLQLLGELDKSTEVQKRLTPIPGLRRSVALQKLARIPLLGPLVASLGGVERTGPADDRSRAAHQLMHRFSVSVGARLVRIADDLFLLRSRQMQALSSETADQGAQQIPTDGCRPDSEERGGPHAQAHAWTSRPAPVVFQFDFAATASPANTAGIDDSRELALGLQTLQITETLSQRQICSIDFSESGNARQFALFGFGASKPWGAWSTGGRSAIVVWHDPPALGDLQVAMVATPYSAAFRSLTCLLTSSAGHRRELIVEGGALAFDLGLAAGGDPNSAMLFGEPSPAASRHNVSLSTQKPLISVIILNFDKPQITCLSARAVLASCISVPFEIILVDNGSSPNAYEILRAYGLPVRIVRLPINRYFGEGNNIGAEQARGEFLAFINNDAFPRKGCIDALLGALRAHPDCGIAGPVFRYPDGRIQEAGGFIAPDGSPQQRGKFDPAFDVARLPEHEAVDYVSAACLMIRAQRFCELGGFNYRYEPAYWEDTDLCFRLRLRNEQVLLVRDAVCMHIENMTTGDANNAAGSGSSIGDRNRQVFLSTWGEYLQSRSQRTLPSHLIPAPRPPTTRDTGPVVHAAHWPYPLLPGSGARFALAATLAMNELGTAALATPNPYSQMRLDNVMFDLGLAADRPRILPASALATQRLDRLLLAGREFYPRYQLRSERTFFYCDFTEPTTERPAADILLGMEILSQCEKVIVGSAFAKRAYEEELQRQRRSAQVEVVMPSVATERLLEMKLNRKPWMVSIGRFSHSERGGHQGLLIDALKAARESWRKEWTLILCGDMPDNPADLAYLGELRGRIDRSINVKFVLSPALPEFESLLAQSSVFVDARGFGVRRSEDHWKCEQLGIAMISSLVAGCSVIGYRVGVAPEIIETTGSGSTFGEFEELASQLQASVVGGANPESRNKAANCYGSRAFTERLIRAVS
jgi:GT2 family glycosyltransferase